MAKRAQATSRQALDGYQVAIPHFAQRRRRHESGDHVHSRYQLEGAKEYDGMHSMPPAKVGHLALSRHVCADVAE